MKKPIFEDAQFNFNHDGRYYNVKFIPTDDKRLYRILIQDWGLNSPFYESSELCAANKTTAVDHLCKALNI